jgi:two-component system, cell cycle sensor histidine kinase and response regulator CckA
MSDERSRWTPRQESEQRREPDLMVHAEYLLQLVDQIPAFLWVIDRDLIVRRIEGGKPMLQTLDRDRLVGLPMAEVTSMGSSPEDLDLSLAMHRRVLDGATERYRATWKGIILEARIRPLRDRRGDIVGILGVGVDVTEQVRMEAQLRGSEERFRAVVDGSTDLIAILDNDFRVSYASPSHRTVLGYRASERERIDPWSLVHPDDEDDVREAFARLESSRAVRMSRPIRIRTKRHEWKSFIVTLTNLRQSEAVRGVVVHARDVTKELALESQLRQSQKLEALGQLAGGVAHDFNNVLAAIMGYAQLLLEDLSPDDRQHHDLAEIVRAAERAASITRQLLAFSRQQPFAAGPLDLVEVVHDLARMLRALLPATIALRVSPERGTPPIVVLADRSHIDQVIMNLVVNARDAMPDGGILSVHVRQVTTGEAQQVAVLEVRDNGAGMSRDVLTHVFEPFFTTKPPGRGTGLGLSTVYGIVRQHSGSIDIDSIVGQGTTVTVRMPITTSGAAPITREPERVSAGGGGRVLVVEDETQVREVAERFLRRAGYDVLTAADGEAALAALTTNGPVDLVLTDSAMPGMRGEDLATAIGRVRPGLPVILMSGYTDPARPASKAVTAHIQKPFTRAALLAEVRRAMAPGSPFPE